MDRSDGPTDAALSPTLASDATELATPKRSSHAETMAGSGVRPLPMQIDDGELPEPGYQIGDVIGRGGMGEVLDARDLRIGRHVAIKRMRAETPSRDAIARFLREARIQARLDHPAIVPVHELGRDAAGRPFFTMKRLTGRTLQEQLGTPDVTAQQLLRAFVDVCLAIDFAHARGVVHRDLKPSNIMLGDYGEVYVLDWGVGRVLGSARDSAVAIDVTTLDGGTQAGLLLGTPGYMAPEQARGEDVGLPADVYALGCILFEILAHDPAHPVGATALQSTLTNRPGSPAERRPERGIAPELDALCVEALQSDAAARPTARGLADRVQRYLDGDRDVGLRRALAAAQIAAARSSLERDDEESRIAAIRAAGHALALDPKSPDAAQLVTSLILVPPRVIPPALAARLAESDTRFVEQQWRTANLAYGAFFLFLPVLMWVGIRDWPSIIAGYACIAAIILVGRSSLRHHTIGAALALGLNTVFMLLFTRLFGSMLVLPGILAVETFAWMSYPAFVEKPWPPILLMLATQAVPVAVEAFGWITPTTFVRGQEIVSVSTALDVSGGWTIGLLVLVSFATILVSGLFARALAKGRRDSQRELEIQSWHMRHLLPT